MLRKNVLDQFPYPFTEDAYRYSNNSVLLKIPSSIFISPHYVEEINLKRKLLKDQPKRCFQALPHTIDAQWEIVELVINHLVTYYPSHFSIIKQNVNWTFINHILDEEIQFIFGDSASLEYEPLNFIGRHVQEDLIYMGQRDRNLYLDAGHLCFPSNWSLVFKLGMSFKEIHNPIPMFGHKGLDDRILHFLKNIEAGNPWERKNWSLMVGNRLDTHLETFNEWGKERKKITEENAGELVHLRVEVQKLFRLSHSNGLLFTIHTHLLPLETFVTKQNWLIQFYQILSELPTYIIEYKGISTYRDSLMAYLSKKLNGIAGKYDE